MKLILGALVIALAVGFLTGGRIANLGHLRIRWAPLALIGLAMQLINPPGRLPLLMLLGSFVLLTVFAVANVHLPGFSLILIGVAMNFAVIAINEGMPVSRQALIASGQADTVSDLTNDADSYVKHHLADSDDSALFLADVIALQPPIGQAISIGDIYTYGGVAVVVVAAMRRRRSTESLLTSSVMPARGEIQGAGG
jgi:Family of unknown function (DUF5317)